DQFAVRRDDVSPLADDRRRRATSFVVPRPGGADFACPKLLAVLNTKAGQVLVLIAGGGGAVAERVNSAARNRQAGIAAAGAASFPDELGSAVGPRFQEARIGRDRGPPWATKGRPGSRLSGLCTNHRQEQ